MGHSLLMSFRWRWLVLVCSYFSMEVEDRRSAETDDGDGYSCKSIGVQDPTDLALCLCRLASSFTNPDE